MSDGACGDRQLVRPVRDRGVEIATLRPAAEVSEPRRERSRLPEPRPAAVAPEHLGLDPVELEQLEGLRVIARRDLDLVAPVAEKPNQRTEHQHVRRRRHVEPDSQTTASARRGSRSGPGVRSTWRSCQSVNERSPHSWRERSSSPATWRSSRRCHRAGLEEALTTEGVRSEDVACERLEVAAKPGGRGNREPALAAVDDGAGEQGRRGLSEQELLPEAAHLHASRKRQREAGHERVEVRHPGLQGVGHRRAVGLHEEVVDEVGAEVDVLEPRQQLGALGLCEARAEEVDRI